MDEILRHRVAIHLGASSLSLLLLESREDEQDIIIDFMEQPVPFARDLFRSGRVKRDTIERCVEIIQGYLKAIAEYGLGIEHITKVAVSNTIKEARNSRAVLNRLKVACGMTFEALEDGDMTRLVYRKVKRRVKDTPSLNTGTSLAIHVGPGNTRIILLIDGKIERYTSYRMGVHRVAEALREEMSYGNEYLRLIRAHCAAQLGAITREFRDLKIDNVMLIGYEIQQVANSLNHEGAKGECLSNYHDFLDKAAKLTEHERVRMYDLDFHAEDALLPALQINFDLLQLFDAERFWISNTHYEQGLLRDLSDHQENQDLVGEILRSARVLAARYKVSAVHTEHVLSLVTQLFEQTKELHGLTESELLLLQVSAIVYEVGGYISSRMHHKHSQYLIQNSEIFGINQNQLQLIALISRYHRQSAPKNSHRDFMMLSDSDQLIVSKLAALLRVADALDANHRQRIKQLEFKKKANKAIVQVHGLTDARIERIALDKKGDLFEDIFGLELHLIEKNTQ